MNYKVGDKVRVRKDLVVDRDYGGVDFIDDMVQFKGKIVTIKRADIKFYCIEGDKGEFAWTDEMLEPVVTNWDKVKEGAKEALEKMNVNNWNNNIFCDSIHAMMGEKNCLHRSCSQCREWLKQPYKEPSILDDAEKSYLRAIIKPWRNKVSSVALLEYNKHKVYISIKIKDEAAGICLPNFELGTMYKGMKINKRYTLKELDL